MIDTSNAKWDLSPEERYAVTWFNDHGFSGRIVKQYVSKTKFLVSKDGVEDRFELIQGVKDLDIYAYMQQYLKSFNLLCEINQMKEQLKNRGGAL